MAIFRRARGSVTRAPRRCTSYPLCARAAERRPWRACARPKRRGARPDRATKPMQAATIARKAATKLRKQTRLSRPDMPD